MWFCIDHGAKKQSEASVALELFLKDQLVDKFHGDGAKTITVNFVPARKKKLVHKLVYGEYIDVQVHLPEEPATGLMGGFTERLERLGEALSFAKSVPLKSGRVDWEQLDRDLSEAISSAPDSPDAVHAYLERRETLAKELRARDQRVMRAQRKANRRPLVKKLKGLRIYEPMGNELSAYLAAFGEVYGARLRETELTTPEYQEIYVYLGRDRDFIEGERALEEWHEITPGWLDFDAFAQADDKERFDLLGQAIEGALLDLAEIDGLDKEAMSSAFEGVRESMLDLDLRAATIENEQHRVDILYNMRHVGEHGRVLHRVRVTDRSSGVVGEAKLDYLDPWSAPYSLGKLTLTKKLLKIRARTGLRAQVSLEHDNLPSGYSFDLREVVDGGLMSPEVSPIGQLGNMPTANGRP